MQFVHIENDDNRISSLNSLGITHGDSPEISLRLLLGKFALQALTTTKSNGRRCL